MPIEIYPKVEVRRLSSVEPGSLIKYEGSFAIAVAEKMQKDKSTILAVLSNSAFTHYGMRGNEMVLDFGHDYIIDFSQSDLNGGPEHPDKNSGIKLYLSENRLLAVMLLPWVQNGWEMVDLRTGIAEPPNGSPMPTIEKWNLGFRDLLNRPTWLIEAPQSKQRK